MKYFLLMPVIIFSFSSLHFSSPGILNRSFTAKDTGFKHITDGKVSEWPEQKFETDPGTGIKWASDNDEQNLYLALIITDSRMQMKMIRNGMELYIDPKGKKKEGKGISFPIKREQGTENSAMNFGTQKNENDTEQETPDQKKARLKTLRAEMALNLTSMKVFGFSADEAEEQGLLKPGSANIAFAWDSSDAMCIEYEIPLSLLGTSSSVTQKEISIGWKLNGFQRSSSENSSSGSSGGNWHGRGEGGGRGNYGGGNHSHGSQDNTSGQQNFENMMKDQSFWTKYTVRE